MMETESGACSSEALVKGIAILQEKWTLLIVSQLLRHPCGFNELSRKADGINATTLSQRLILLEEVGVVEKTVHSTMPPRTSYELTESGRALQPVIDAIEQWSEKYLPKEEVCPLAQELKQS